MEHVSDSTYAEQVEGSEIPVVLDFGATWCGPCKKIEPVLDELSKEYTDKVRFLKVDVGEAPETARKFGVMSVPTVIFMKSGEPVHRFSGVQSKDKIAQMLGEHLGV